MSDQEQINSHYDASDIVELKYPQNVRQKIGMYLGSSDQRGFQHTFTEIIDNSIDEFVAGHGKKIEVWVDSKTHHVAVRDWGRGIPFEKNKDGVSALTLALTTLHAGGKHSNSQTESSYKYSSGVHGVGASVVQAASDFFNVIVFRGKKKAFQQFKNGKPVTDVINLGVDETIEWYKGTDTDTGTFIEYKPSIKKDEFDSENVFENNCRFELDWFKQKLKYIPYLNIGLEIVLHFDGETVTFNRQTSVTNILISKPQKLVFDESKLFNEEYAFVQNKESGNKKVLNIKAFKDMPQTERDTWHVKTSSMDLVFNFVENDEPIQLYFVNGVLVKGGKQEQSLRLQLKTFFNEYIAANKKGVGALDIEDIIANFSFMYSVKINDPMFSGQTKESLNNPEVSTIATHFLKKFLSHWINREDKKDMDRVIKLIEANKKARLASEKIRENVFKEIFGGGDDEFLLNKGKLKDCSSKDKTKTELFIVEGDSAGGSADTGRSFKYQALLPLKGKPLNVIKKANQIKIFGNDEIISLVTSLGVGQPGTENYSLDKLNYHKIILMADADVDGQHINALMLTFFFHFYQGLIELGHIYLALSPLYKIVIGKDIFWAWNKAELDAITSGKSRFTITRNKGLGEMNAEELWDTTLNPATRKLVQVKIEDFEREKESFEIFMGDDADAKDVLKEIISSHYEGNEEKLILRLSSPEEAA